MEIKSSSRVRQRPLQRSPAGRASLCRAALIAGAVCLAGTSQVFAASEPQAAAASTTGPGPSRAPEFIPLDPSLQPQTGNTGIQVPDAASDQEVKGELGSGLVLLVTGVVFTVALGVWVFMVVMRRSWDSNHAPASQRRNFQ
jgi:hypothetical protein